MSGSSAFISYHHEDSVIGEALHDQLSFLAAAGEGRRALSVFLDSRDIGGGTPWQPEIDKNLAEKDWLVVVYTGQQSVYCGYEIGTFTHLHAAKPLRRIIALHDVADDLLPVVLRGNQNRSVAPVEIVTNLDDVIIEAGELGAWFSSPVGRFLRDFCQYNGLYTPEHERNDPARYNANVALAAKKVATAFSLASATDVKSETPTQISFEILIKRLGKTKISVVPDEATIVGTSLFFDILDTTFPVSWDQAPTATWKELRQVLDEDGRKKVPWMHKVERDLVRAVGARGVSSDDVTFRGKNGKIYRPILVRHKLFANGDRRFYLLFVETLDRRFVGSESSSLLLTDLILASRWRFTYLEQWNETINRVFGETTPLATFVDNCRQLLYNIEWMEHEAAEYGANDPEDLVKAFGPAKRARVERFFSDWVASKRLLDVVLPDGLDTSITDGNRSKIRAGIVEFLEQTRVQNADFLSLAVQSYSEHVSADLAVEANLPAASPDLGEHCPDPGTAREVQRAGLHAI